MPRQMASILVRQWQATPWETDQELRPCYPCGVWAGKFALLRRRLVRKQSDDDPDRLGLKVTAEG